MTKTAQEFLDSGEYLPEFMRGFHDQKLLFKFVGEIVVNAKSNQPFPSSGDDTKQEVS